MTKIIPIAMIVVGLFLAGALLPNVVIVIYQTGLAIYAYLALGALALGTYRMPRDADPIAKNGFRET